MRTEALLRGTAAAEPVLSHETHGVVYETFPLAVRRLSGSGGPGQCPGP